MFVRLSHITPQLSYLVVTKFAIVFQTQTVKGALRWRLEQRTLQRGDGDDLVTQFSSLLTICPDSELRPLESCVPLSSMRYGPHSSRTRGVTRNISADPMSTR
jgi:hypothetical protein